jgi:hypothetical protein
MPPSLPRIGAAYSPLYFLAALGNGGLAVAFFMMLLFWVPHPGRPVPVHEDIVAAFAGGGPAMQIMIAVAMAGIAIFAAQHIRYLVWNLRSYAAWIDSAEAAKLGASNAETQKLALPLALAMGINVGFVLGLVFVPGLWRVVEYLFPAALLAFLAVGALALRQIGDFLGRVLVRGGGFSHAANNSYAQLLPAFALSMIGVGLAAPVAMSASPTVAGLAMVLSTFFLVAAALYGLVALILGVHAMMEHGAAEEAAPTLMIVIPILTVLGILTLRQQHGLHIHFGVDTAPGETLAFLGMLLSVQVLFGLLGLLVLRRQGYVGKYLGAGQKSPGSYALICPGVALSVMLHFFTNKGLVAAGVIGRFGVAYWVSSGLAVAFMLATIGLLLWLNRQHFGTREPAGPRVTPDPAVPYQR